jgi:DNA-directed RNA polymerase specialized sigma24 family protein
MANSSVPKPGRKADWILTQSAFRQLLDWLDEGVNSDGTRYLEIRKRLALYFDRKNCLTPDEMADETLNRVARRLEEEGAISTDTPAHYCYIVARFVLLEDFRRSPEKPIDEKIPAISDATDQQQETERRFGCLERCMETLDPDERTLIVNYYQGEQRAKIENRRAIALKLGMTVNALSIRACRIRTKLENCVRKCLSGAK